MMNFYNPLIELDEFEATVETMYSLCANRCKKIKDSENTENEQKEQSNDEILDKLIDVVNHGYDKPMMVRDLLQAIKNVCGVEIMSANYIFKYGKSRNYIKLDHVNGNAQYWQIVAEPF